MATYPFDVNGELYEVQASSEEVAREALIQMLREQAGETDQPQQLEQAPAPQGPVDPWAAQAQKIREDEESVGGPAALARPAATGLGRVGAGAGKLAVYGAEAASRVLGVESPLGRLSDYNSAANDLLDQIRGKKYEDAPISEWLPERAVELGAGFLLGGGAAKSYKIKDVAMQGLKAGGFGAATTFDDSDTLAEKTGSIALGALAGLGLSAGVAIASSAPGKAHKWWVGKMANQRDEAQRKAVIEIVNQFPELKSYLTIGQRTGSLAMADSEARAAGQYALRAYRAQAEILSKRLREYGQRYGTGFNPEELAAQVATRGRSAGRAYLRDLRTVRKAEWDAMMGSAEAAITANKISNGGIEGAEQYAMPVVVDFQNELLRIQEKYGLADKKVFGPQVQKLAREIEAFNGNVSMETVVDVLKRLNADQYSITSGTVPPEVQQAISNEFKGLIYKMVDDAPENVNDALTWVKRARMNYSMRAAEVEQFQESAIAKALQMDKFTPDPLKSMEQFAQLSKAQQMRARDILGKYDPDLLNEIRGHFWDQAMQKAMNTAQGDPARASNFDPSAFINNMLDGDELRLSGLFGDVDRAMMKEVLPDLRALYFKLNGTARTPELENAAMTAAQGVKSGFTNMAFVARQGFRFFNKFFDERYFTPQGRAAIKAAANARDPADLAAALGRLEAMSGAADVLLGMEPE